MRNFLEKATNLVFGTALVLSLINMNDSIFGVTWAVNWVLGTELPAKLLIPIAIFAWGALFFSWLSTVFTNASGMMIYAANISEVPLFYEFLGILYTIGLLIAVLPFVLYFWGNALLTLSIQS